MSQPETGAIIHPAITQNINRMSATTRRIGNNISGAPETARKAISEGFTAMRNRLKGKTSSTSPTTSPESPMVSDFVVKSRYADKFNINHRSRINNTEDPKNSYKIIIEISRKPTGRIPGFKKTEGGKLIIVWGAEKKFFDLLNIVSFNINGKTLDQYTMMLNRIDILEKLWNEREKGSKSIDIDCGNHDFSIDSESLLLYFISKQLTTCGNYNKRMNYLMLNKNKNSLILSLALKRLISDSLKGMNAGSIKIYENRNFGVYNVPQNNTNNIKKKRQQIKTQIMERAAAAKAATGVATSAAGVATGNGKATDYGNIEMINMKPSASANAGGEGKTQERVPYEQVKQIPRTPLNTENGVLNPSYSSSGGSRRGRRTSSRSVSTKRRSRSRSVTKKKTTKRSSSKKKRSTSKTRKTKRTTKK
jgi:hypothetical protein